MKWFDNWFARKCKQAWEDSHHDDREEVNYPVPRMRSRKGSVLATSSTDSTDLQSSSTTFKLYQANGGTVIELRHYNEAREQWDTSLHVISKDEDLGKAIEHIITYEALKR